MSRTLSNTTVGDDISIRRDIPATVDLAQLISRFERAIGIRCRCPGNALGGRYVPTALRTLLWVVDHVDQLTGILLRRAHIDQAAIGVIQPAPHIIAVGTNGFIPWMRMIGSRCKMRDILGKHSALGFPLLPSAIHDLQVLVTKHREQPE